MVTKEIEIEKKKLSLKRLFHLSFEQKRILHSKKKKK